MPKAFPPSRIESECADFNLCLEQPQPCGGKSYYCVKQGEKFLWSESNSYCTPISRGNIEPSGNPIPVEDKENPENATNATNEAEFKVTSYFTVPDIIREGSNLELFAETNSRNDLSSIVCDKPKDTGECICNPGFKNSKANFRCIMYPPVLGNYSIILKNGLATAGISAYLEPGKPAIVTGYI